MLKKINWSISSSVFVVAACCMLPVSAMELSDNSITHTITWHKFPAYATIFDSLQKAGIEGVYGEATYHELSEQFSNKLMSKKQVSEKVERILKQLSFFDSRVCSEALTILLIGMSDSKKICNSKFSLEGAGLTSKKDAIKMRLSEQELANIRESLAAALKTNPELNFE